MASSDSAGNGMGAGIYRDMGGIWSIGWAGTPSPVGVNLEGNGEDGVCAHPIPPCVLELLAILPPAITNHPALAPLSNSTLVLEVPMGWDERVLRTGLSEEIEVDLDYTRPSVGGGGGYLN